MKRSVSTFLYFAPSGRAKGVVCARSRVVQSACIARSRASKHAAFRLLFWFQVLSFCSGALGSRLSACLPLAFETQPEAEPQKLNSCISGLYFSRFLSVANGRRRSRWLRTVEMRNGCTEQRKCVCNAKGVSTDYGCSTYYRSHSLPGKFIPYGDRIATRPASRTLRRRHTSLTRVTEQVDCVGGVS